MDWKSISKQPTLSEEFMREHADNLDWIRICLKKNLSMHFMTEMIDYIFLSIIRQRFQEGSLPYVNQETFAQLEDCYANYWNNNIRIAGGVRGIQNKEKIKIAFTLDEKEFPSSHSYTKLSIVFQLDDRAPEYTMTGFSHSTLDRETIPFSSLFLKEQQKEAFFYSVNRFLLLNNFIEKPISFYY